VTCTPCGGAMLRDPPSPHPAFPIARPHMHTLPDSPRSHAPRAASYTVRLARDGTDIETAQRLRFEVFNLELNEGLDAAYLSGLDADQFDECCDHLLVEEARSGAVVGTYRLQTGQLAAANHGYYSAQ